MREYNRSVDHSDMAAETRLSPSKFNKTFVSGVTDFVFWGRLNMKHNSNLPFSACLRCAARLGRGFSRIVAP